MWTIRHQWTCAWLCVSVTFCRGRGRAAELGESLSEHRSKLSVQFWIIKQRSEVTARQWSIINNQESSLRVGLAEWTRSVCVSYASTLFSMMKVSELKTPWRTWDSNGGKKWGMIWREETKKWVEWNQEVVHSFIQSEVLITVQPCDHNMKPQPL